MPHQTLASLWISQWVIIDRAVAGKNRRLSALPQSRPKWCGAASAALCQYQTPLLRRPMARDRDIAKVAILLIPTALALAVRFHGLSDKPLWLDEIITQRRANLPISDLIANSLYNKQFPTYFVLIRAFDAPIINEWMLRLPSAILGAISVLLVSLIATEVRSR